MIHVFRNYHLATSSKEMSKKKITVKNNKEMSKKKLTVKNNSDSVSFFLMGKQLLQLYYMIFI